jgi:hypothetical protein
MEGIVRTVEAMERASQFAHVWRLNLSDPASAAAAAAGTYATEAAHHARRLQGVAELVSVSGDLAAWQEWRERGKA